MQQKQIAMALFIIIAVLLLLLPLVLTFNDVLTQAMVKNRWYSWLQDTLVPLEIKMVGLLVTPFGVRYAGYNDGIIANGRFARVSWNCLGWQSLLLLAVTLVIGFWQGKYTLTSKLETIALGITGVFLVNLVRIAFTVLLLAYSQLLFKLVFHDFLAALVTIGFLICFWWFVYRFILEERITSPSHFA